MKRSNTRKRTIQYIRSTVLHCLYWLAVLLYLETALHLRFFGGFDGTWLYTVFFSLAIAMGIACITGFLPPRANKITSMVLVSLLCVVYGSQIVYEAAFGTMYSVSQMGMGGAVVTNFFKETVMTIWHNLDMILLILLPIPATALLLRFKGSLFAVKRHWFRIMMLPLAAIVHVVTLCCLTIGGTGDYTNFHFYYSSSATTDQAAERFGLLTTMRVEAFSNRILEEEEDPTPSFEIPIVTVPATEPVPQETVVPGETTAPTEPTEPKKEYNVLEIDFDYLNTLTKDKARLALNSYVESLSGTKTNEYTGMLADYNLITLCAESFSPAAIREDLTPTLYKLANEGIVFNNYYNAYPNNTTNGEYSFCLGLWPDTTRDKATASFYASRHSYLPFALGNVFQEQLGIQSYGYHNYKGSYYGRELTHPNMGYECKFSGSGMTFNTGSPTSDLEMMEQSIDDYITADRQFHAYYMTYSGHYQYEKYNPMARRNYDAVKHLPYSENALCYLACNLELEKAMAYLMQRLEEEGIADKTAIVLAGDHFPYGLSNDQYEELVGYEIDAFSKYKSTLIFWVGGLEETIYVDDYMCNTDILPTILNLWGFSYDSRLMAGTDIFSDSEHIAILRDQSFLTDKVWFNASKGKATWLVDESTVDPNYLDNHIKMVKNQFTISSSILNEAYYNFLFEKGKVEIVYDSWKGETNTNQGDDKEEAPNGNPEGNVGNTPGTNTGNNTGTNTGNNTGNNTDNNTGTNTGTNTGGNTGTNTGTNTGNNTDGNTGANTGGNTGDNAGNNTENNTGDEPDDNTGENTGNNTGGTTDDNTGENTGGNNGVGDENETDIVG